MFDTAMVLVLFYQNKHTWKCSSVEEFTRSTVFLRHNDNFEPGISMGG